jgi:hypothetical protein
MNRLRTRLFLKFPDGQLQPSDLEIELPQRFTGFPGKPLAAEHRPVYQAIAHFPGVLDAEGFAFRSWSTLEAMVGVMASVRAFWKDFEKAGGKVYLAMVDNEDAPNLEEPVRIKDFFVL